MQSTHLDLHESYRSKIADTSVRLGGTAEQAEALLKRLKILTLVEVKHLSFWLDEYLDGCENLPESVDGWRLVLKTSEVPSTLTLEFVDNTPIEEEVKKPIKKKLDKKV